MIILTQTSLHVEITSSVKSAGHRTVPGRASAYDMCMMMVGASTIYDNARTNVGCDFQIAEIVWPQFYL